MDDIEIMDRNRNKIVAHGEKVHGMVTRIHALEDKRECLFDELRMWGDVERQGIDPKLVKSFFFNFGPHSQKVYTLNKAQTDFLNQIDRGWKSWTQPKYYSHVLFHNGTVRQLNPPVKVPKQINDEPTPAY